jgi:hypothetical protein
MKKLLMAGGLVGFLIGLVLGLLQQSTWPSIFWRSSVAALAAGLLIRWWGRVWVRSLREAYSERLAAEERAAAPPASSVPFKP